MRHAGGYEVFQNVIMNYRSFKN